MTKVSFGRDQYGAPSFSADDAWSAYGAMLTGDVQTDRMWLLDLLAWIEDARSGRLDSQTWQGNSWSVQISAKGVSLDDVYSDDWSGSYSLDDAHQVAMDYLAFLEPTPEGRATAATGWRGRTGRDHPCAAHF